MGKLISIIIPIFNGEEFLERTIKSILSQSYSSFELILVNDGSTDASLTICQQFDDPRIQIIEQENAGVSVARNNGINVAKGDFILFVDCDDVVEVNMLEKLLSYNSKEDELIIFGYYIHNLDKNDEITKNRGNVVSKKLTTREIATNFWTYYSEGLINSPCNKLYLTSIIKNNKFQFPKGVKMGEDLIFNLQYFDKIKTFLVCDDYLYHYYLYEDQSSRKVHLSIGEDMILFLKEIEAFLLKEKVGLSEQNNQIFKHLLTALQMPYRSNEVGNADQIAYVKETIRAFKEAFPNIQVKSNRPYDFMIQHEQFRMIHYLLKTQEASKKIIKRILNKN